MMCVYTQWDGIELSNGAACPSYLAAEKDTSTHHPYLVLSFPLGRPQ